MRSGTRPTIVYRLGEAAYVNLTNRCTARCIFCPGATRPVVQDHDLAMDPQDEPSVEDVVAVLGDPTAYEEVVFCGFGEPTLRLGVVCVLARWLKAHRARVRLNTNGHGNLIHGRSIVPAFVGLLDAVSISLNAGTANEYARLVPCRFGAVAFDAVKQFIRECRALLPEVRATVVAVPGLDLDACRATAEELGVALQVRQLNALGA